VKGNDSDSARPSSDAIQASSYRSTGVPVRKRAHTPTGWPFIQMCSSAMQLEQLLDADGRRVALDARDSRLADAQPRTQIGLAEATGLAQRAQVGGELQRSQDRIVHAAAYAF
jgi:hypothetical protein